MNMYVISWVVGVIVYMALGMAWYSNKMFGERWRKLSELSEADAKMTNKSLLVSLGGTCVSIASLQLILYISQPQSWVGALLIGALITLPLVTVFVNQSVYGRESEQKKKIGVAYIDLGYYGLGYCLVAIISFFLS